MGDDGFTAFSWGVACESPHRCGQAARGSPEKSSALGRGGWENSINCLMGWAGLVSGRHAVSLQKPMSLFGRDHFIPHDRHRFPSNCLMWKQRWSYTIQLQSLGPGVLGTAHCRGQGNFAACRQYCRAALFALCRMDDRPTNNSIWIKLRSLGVPYRKLGAAQDLRKGETYFCAQPQTSPPA
jgi:hypothetical protein